MIQYTFDKFCIYGISIGSGACTEFCLGSAQLDGDKEDVQDVSVCLFVPQDLTKPLYRYD